MMSGILVVVEHRKNEIRDITFEVLNLANEISKENKLDLYALLLEGEEKGLLDILRPLCNKVIKISNPILENYSPEAYIAAIKNAINAISPLIIMMGHTSFGMDLAPALSETLEMPLITDCIDVKIRDNRLHVSRQIYGGKIYSELLIRPYSTYMVTIRPGTFEPIHGLNVSADIMEIQMPDIQVPTKRRFLDYVEEKIEDIDISSADVLVSIGRGIGKPENIPLVKKFAEEIGAVLSCSRPVADKGWLPKSRQVGTSGKTVRPKIYIALGISGAFQHQVGMKNSNLIIAVNKDPKAPIFNIAHYGVVADMFQVLPVLEEKLKKNA